MCVLLWFKYRQCACVFVCVCVQRCRKPSKLMFPLKMCEWARSSGFFFIWSVQLELVCQGLRGACWILFLILWNFLQFSRFLYQSLCVTPMVGLDAPIEGPSECTDPFLPLKFGMWQASCIYNLCFCRWADVYLLCLQNDQQLDCALDLMRRLPPQQIEKNLSDLIDLVSTCFLSLSHTSHIAHTLSILSWSLILGQKLFTSF